MIYLSYAASYPSFIDSQTPKLPMGNKFSVTFAIGIVAMILLVIFIVIASKIRRAWIKVTKLKDCSFVPQQNGGKAANQINARAASSSFGQPLQQTTNRPQLQGTAPQSCRRCGLGNLQLGQQRLTRSLQLGHGRLQSGVGLPPPLGGGLQTGRHQHSPGLQGLGKQLPLRGGVKVKRATQKINTADIRHSSVQQQVESIGNSATTNTQVPTIPERQGFLYIPRQPGCVHNVDRGSNKTADTLNTLEESVSQGITMDIELVVNMCGRITELWETKQHTDVTLLVQGSRIPAHRIILASQSDYFDRLLYGDMREASQDEIQLHDVESLKAFQMLMQYIYSGRLKIQNCSTTDALDVLNLSDQFGFEPLKNAIGDQLTATIDLNNVLQLLTYADMYQVTKLVASCCAFVDRHAENVLSSDAIATINHHALTLILSRDSLCVPEMQIFQTVMRWKENNDGNDEALKEVLSCVRLTEIPPQALLSEIEATSLFEQDNIMLALKAQLLPDFEIMNPRGIKRLQANLTNDAKLDLVMNTSTSGLQPVNTFGIVKLTPPQLAMAQPMSTSRRTGYWNSPSFSSVQVTLKEQYFVNAIELEGLPNQPVNPIGLVTHNEVPMVSLLPNEKFSYIIQVSKNGNDWQNLVDYSQYGCHRIQRLQFPPLAFRFFQFQLKNGLQPLDLKIVNCSFVEDNKPLKFRANGVIAPLFPLNPLAYQMRGSNPQILQVEFNQPYSVSTLSFTICGPANSRADFVVHSIHSWQHSKTEFHIGQVIAHPFNEQLTVEFDEQVLTSITIEIKNVVKSMKRKFTVPLASNGPTTSESATPGAPFTSCGLINRPHPAQGAPLSGSTGTSGRSEDIVLYRIAGLTCQTKLT